MNYYKKVVKEQKSELREFELEHVCVCVCVSVMGNDDDV